MKNYSNAEIDQIIKVITDPQYDAVRMRITTDALDQHKHGVALEFGSNQGSEKGDAELGGNS